MQTDPAPVSLPPAAFSAAVTAHDMANAIRALAMDAVQQAASGHPGAPMGMAEMAVALWGPAAANGRPGAGGGHLRHDPLAPHWPNRDRFVLSNGHASMLLYALLHLTGYDLPMTELQRFRQLHSRTPGHPEHGITPGVETTTGPLGQGVANAVGMALAEKLLAAEFNRPGHNLVDHHTYVFLGDGCLMEGVSHEAVALAGAWKLNKLVALYDDNGISIDGAVAPWFVDDTRARFRACGWEVLGPVDGHDAQAVSAALETARRSAERPVLIVCQTTIGRGSPQRAGTAKAHGEPLGVDEIARTREALNWTAPAFEVPEPIRAAWDARPAGAAAHAEWQAVFAAYQAAHPELAAEFNRRMAGALPATLPQTVSAALAAAMAKAETVASRKASQLALETLTAALPELLGGSADLTGSNLTNTRHTPPLRIAADGAVVRTAPADGAAGAAAASIGRHINYGVREFGMAAVMNGIALHGGYIPYGGTFLTFSDYSRNAIRMAALMKQRVVHVFTHDSIGLGEDGPTHQSVEHAASLRLIPGLDVWRPCDTAETLVAWAEAIARRDRPSALLLSRQNLPYAPRSGASEAAPRSGASEAAPRSGASESTPRSGDVQAVHAAIAQGAYVLAEPSEVGLKRRAEVVLIATGSEVGLALQAQALLADATNGRIAARVVSMPSTTVFDRQSVATKRAVLPDGVPRVAVEAGVTDGWWKYGCAAVVGLDTYGESAPASVLFPHFGFTAQNLCNTVRKVLGR